MGEVKSEIGRTSIDEYVRMRLWAVSGGRCEMCNRLLYQDLVFGHDANFGEMAHIHAVSENGPRHKYGMSQEEKNNIDNLMLLCAEHHHMIDTHPEDFSDGLLIKKKKCHEDRIRQVTGIPSEQSCRIVTYFSNINNQAEFSSDRLLRQAVLLSGRVPMQEPAISLNEDSITKYVPTKAIFEQKAQDLERQFKVWFNEVIKSKDSIGVFSLAPQPLLFKLGTLINDQYNTVVFQCHRSGHKWAWPDKSDVIKFDFKCTKEGTPNKVALVMDLSATVLDDRITSVLGDDATVFHITMDNPCRTFVTSEAIQEGFIKTFREAMEYIKNLRPAPTEIHTFQVMPNSLAIRAGMDYMPKTDLPIILYEQANQSDGFFEALSIGR